MMAMAMATREPPAGGGVHRCTGLEGGRGYQNRASEPTLLPHVYRITRAEKALGVFLYVSTNQDGDEKKGVLLCILREIT